ncbi:MAG: TetR/AcrR family transcriptional regulator [Ignavibacteria bacterium]|jgi:AcrR family transcriptional regulator|nr:TetR/AcrR family transcriptional regulator [Ignavibacteria bacterium]MDP3829777.1 TetR/AcrR family transcriptional regulator [Ignavibacteriaceae bacterium]
MNLKINKHLASESRNKILVAAALLFARDGYYRVSVREICESANVSKPVLYYYFKDKENLLEELVKETYLRAEELKIKHLSATIGLEELLKGIGGMYKEFLLAYPHLTRFSAFIQSGNVPDKILLMKTERYLHEKREFVNTLKKYQKSGVLTQNVDADILFLNFIGSIIMLIAEYIIMGENHSMFSKKIDKFIDVWIKTFLIKENK